MVAKSARATRSSSSTCSTPSDRARSGASQAPPSVSCTITRYCQACFAVRMPPATLSPTARPVRIARAGDADCRLQWTVYKAYVSNDPALPKTSVCQEPGTLQLEPNTVYILVVDKPGPAVSGLYGFTLT